MLEKVKYVLGISTTRPVFVIGTGRSGTHWLGYSLGYHSEVRATVETQPMYNLSNKMALNPTLEEKLFGRLVAAYRWQLFKTSRRVYLDKSHPNIWLAEKLKEAFPHSLFVAIERNPYATVASMMQHEKVSAWHKRWKEFPIPNRFLGITPELADVYDTIPFASQCAMRWVAHHDRLKELKNILGQDLLVISYETFAHKTEKTVQELQQFLGLDNPIPTPEVKKESLDKWKSQLTDEQVMQIQNIVGFAPDTDNNQDKTAHIVASPNMEITT